MRILSPSTLSVDFGNIERDIKMLERSRAQWLHIDVMDGLFVPNISYGFPVMEAIRRNTTKPLDVHLMIVEPERYIERFVREGAGLITFHLESTDKVQHCIDITRQAGARVAISLKPQTPLSEVEQYLPQLDMVLLMSVEPGFGGQSFIEGTMDRIVELRRMIDAAGLETLIEVDGGISRDNAAQIFEAGADVLVAGNSIFKREDPEQEIAIILDAGL